MSSLKVGIIGAGPAGLTAGYHLAKAGVEVEIFEAHPRLVGGISRTEEFDGFFVDIGGHRFFSKSREIEDLWTEILGPDMLTRPRSSKIFFRRKFFSYPLKLFEALGKLGFADAAACVFSYARARLRPARQIRTFEDWVVDRFGRRLFELFFKSYTEKVWGMKCHEISADWAAQRIKGMSLIAVIKTALLAALPSRPGKHESIKSLITSFRYPRRGPGMLWRACADRVIEHGGRLHLGHHVTGLLIESTYESREQGIKILYRDSSSGEERSREFTHVISSAALAEVTLGIRPELPATVREAAKSLKFRSFITVALITRLEARFMDNWLYIHDPEVLSLIFGISL